MSTPAHELQLPDHDDVIDSMAADDRQWFSALFMKRASSELHIAVAFAAIATDLIALRFPIPIVQLAANAVGDEVRHATHWHRLANKLHPIGELHAPDLLDIASMSDDPLERVVLRSLAMSAFNETIACARLQAMLWNIRGPSVRAVLHAILSDEVHHARLGWAVLGHLRERENIRALVSKRAPKLLESSFASLFADPLETQETLAESRTFNGVLNRFDTQMVCAAAVRDLVLPGLASVGIDVGPATSWLTAFRASIPAAG